MAGKLFKYASASVATNKWKKKRYTWIWCIITYTYISCIRSAEEIDLLPGFGACCIVDSSINTFEAEPSWGLFLCLSVCLFLQSCRTTMLTSLRTFVQLSIPFRLFRFRNSSGNKMGNESFFQLCYEHSLLILILYSGC